jgi:hypothetical protein
MKKSGKSPKQSRLPHEMALELASCTAEHRDISLHF